MKNFLRTCLQESLHLIYPHVCICCQHLLPEEENYICATCYEQFDKFLLPGESGEEIFARLNAHFPAQTAIQKGFALYRFHKGGLLQDVIHNIKYAGMQKLAVELGGKLGQHLLNEQPEHAWEAVMPVPLHPVKFIERGYNQAEALAKGVSQATGIPMIQGAVERVKYTESQTGLAAAKRRENLSGVFRAQKPLQQKQVLLIDDVFTTGATLVALSNELKKSGVRTIGIATVAVTST